MPDHRAGPGVFAVVIAAAVCCGAAAWLVGAGRTPNTDDLGVEHLNLHLDPRGYVPVDTRLHTPADGVWALGDLRGHQMFTHTARDDADAAYRTVFKDQDRTIAPQPTDPPPTTTWTHRQTRPPRAPGGTPAASCEAWNPILAEELFTD